MKTVSIGKVTLPINEVANEYIPEEQTIVGYRNVLKTLAYSASKNIPTLLIGETGLGKTALVRHLAHKTNNGFRRLNLNGQTTVDEFVGRTLLNKDGTFWQDGVLTDAMRKGYWLLLDEVNAALPEILFVMHSLLDDDKYIVIPENNGEIVRPHPNFRIFATMNPSGRYTGTKELNKAFMSRFPIILQLEYPYIREEVKIIQSHADVDNGVAMNLCSMAKDIRSSYFKDEIDYVCSTRDLINCAKVSLEIGIKEALELCIINRANSSDSKAIKTIVQLYFGTIGKVDPEDSFSMTHLIKISNDIRNSYEKELLFLENRLNLLRSSEVNNEVKDILSNIEVIRERIAPALALIKGYQDKHESK